MEPSNILVIKHGALGDIILATAGFAAIRKAHPGAKIHCLTTKPFADLLAQSPYFDEIWVDSKPKLFDRAAIKRLKQMLNSKQWEWVYDLQTSNRSTRYQWLLKRPWPQISNVSRWSSHGYTDPARHTRHALDNLRLQLKIAGIESVGLPDLSWMTADISELVELIGTTRMVPLERKMNPFALLVPGGAAHRPEKRWPAEQYASLAQELNRKGIRPVLIGTQAESEALNSIATRVPQAINLCGRTSIPQLATLAREAALAVGNDTGPMHIIGASNCPSTVLFSHTSDPARSAPVGNTVTILREKDLSTLTVDRVLTTLTPRT